MISRKWNKRIELNVLLGVKSSCEIVLNILMDTSSTSRKHQRRNKLTKQFQVLTKDTKETEGK